MRTIFPPNDYDELTFCDPKPAIHDDAREQVLVRNFFRDAVGYFVEVGANDPTDGSQTRHLEERGWQGVLVEPIPTLAAALRKARKAHVFEVACSSPENAGQFRPFYVAGKLSSLDQTTMAPGARTSSIIDVSVRTLDDVLAEANAPCPIDFLSIDVEGHEIAVLKGFNFALWRPRLILIEDHVGNLSKHRFLQANGYRLVRRTRLNGWYIPDDTPVDFDPAEHWRIVRKYYLALPIRKLRNLSRRVRQPFKDAR